MKRGGREYYYTAFFDPAEGGYRDYACLVRGDTEELYIDHCGGLWDSMIIDALDIPDRLLEVKAAFLHSSFITVGGRGYSLRATSRRANPLRRRFGANTAARSPSTATEP